MIIANRTETSFADNQDLRELGVFFSLDRIVDCPPFRGMFRERC
jgi:hypothetical protein